MRLLQCRNKCSIYTLLLSSLLYINIHFPVFINLIHHIPNRLSSVNHLFHTQLENLNRCQCIIMKRPWSFQKRPKSFRKRIKSFSKRPRSLRRRWNYADERNSVSQESWNNLLSHITGTEISYSWGFCVKAIFLPMANLRFVFMRE